MRLEKAELLLSDFHLKEESRVLIGFSGGADSTALLVFLGEQLGSERLTALHIHHGIRGAEADRDEAFCRKFCEERGIAFLSERVDVPALADEKGISLETAGRDARYALFEEAASQIGCSYVALAHHLNDFAETFLFRLARGSGSAGLSSIPSMRPLGKAEIIRPFLTTEKRELEAYLSVKGFPFVKDSTNDSDDHARNLIRHRVIPALEEVNPGFLGHLYAASALVRSDDLYLEALAEKEYRERVSPAGLDTKELYTLPDPVSSRVVRRFLLSRGAPVANHVLASVKSLFSPAASPSASADIGEGFRLCRRYQHLCVVQGNKPASFEPMTVPLVCDGDYLLSNGIRVLIRHMPFPGSSAASPSQFFLRTNEKTLLLRPRRPGDRFTSAGGSKELKKLFIDKKIPQTLRAEAPVGEIAGEVAFVYLIGTSKPFWVPSVGETCIQICINYPNIQEDHTS